MTNRSKTKRERLAAASRERHAEISARKRQQRERFRSSHAAQTSLREKLLMLVKGAWYVLGGPLVWLLTRGPLFRNRGRADDRSRP